MIYAHKTVVSSDLNGHTVQQQRQYFYCSKGEILVADETLNP